MMIGNEKNQSANTTVKRKKMKDFSDGSVKAKRILNISSLVGGIIIWWLLTRISYINVFLASPYEVYETLISESQANFRYFKDIWYSLQRVFVGFGLAFIAAVPIAFLMGWYPKFRACVDPWLKFFKTIPPIALISLVVLAMGLTEKAKYTVIFIAVFLVMVVTIYQGIREVDRTLVKAAYTFGASDFAIFKDIIIPASFPFILVACRLGISTALTTLIASELTGANFGIGARIQQAQSYMNKSLVLLGIITIGVIGSILDGLLLQLEKRLTRWK
ncbi:MAG: ABC transporter permease [Bacillota bacterium]